MTATERLMPGQKDLYWLVQQNIDRYAFACKFLQNQKALDLACGCGHGTSMIGEFAHFVVGLDVSKVAIDVAHTKYGASKVEFLVGDACRLPYRSESVDAIVAFEAIEHMKDPLQFLAECRRVLTSEGLFFCSTPNKARTSPLTLETPENPFHLYEFYPSEFEKAIRHFFDEVTFYGQREGASESDLRVVDFREIQPSEHGSDHYPVVIGPHLDEQSTYLYHMCFAQRPRRALDHDIALVLPILRQDELVQRLQSDLQQKSTTIDRLELQVRELLLEIGRLQDENSVRSRELNQIHLSFGYRFMRFYARRFDSLLPDGTNRGRIRRKVTELLSQ